MEGNRVRQQHAAGPDCASTLASIGTMTSELTELLDYVQDVFVWTKDPDRRFLWLNMPLVLDLGMQTRAQVIGRTDFDFCSPTLANQYRLDDERVLQGGRVMGRVELIGRFEHVARWCATTKIPLHDRRGRIIGTAGVAYPLDGRGHPPVAETPLAPAIRFISEHYSESISNGQLAKACGLSVRALERQFRASYHLSPHDYIRQLRIRLSCGALVYSRKSLAAVASEFGFADQSHFSKEFRHYFGETPSAYRARHAATERVSGRAPPRALLRNASRRY